MDENIILENTYNSFLALFSSKQNEEVELANLGFIPTKCFTPKISMLIHCMENIDLFNTEQKENINIMINRYRNV